MRATEREEKIKVVVRIRPPPTDGSSSKKCRQTRGGEIYRENGSLAWKWDRNQLLFFEGADRVGGENRGQQYDFSHIFPMNVSTREVYEVLGKPIVQRTFEGYNGCIFAYGQTNSGKTYTISGEGDSPGIVSLAVTDFFDHIRHRENRVSLLRVAFIEVYNEQLKDLLVDRQPNLIIQDDPCRGPAVVNLSEHVVSSLDQVLTLISLGEQRRMFGKNNVHEHASRSHTIFQLIFESRMMDEKEVKISTLSIVDLAGSELTLMATDPTPSNYVEQLKEQQTIAAQAAQMLDKRTLQTRPLREREGANIRKSLLALSRVVNTLARNPSEHIPYRDSKLTRILRSALGGNSTTAIVATINPWMSATDDKETNATLRFASTAQTINNKPNQVNVMSERALLERYQDELKDLRTQMLMRNEANTNLVEQLRSEKMQMESQLYAQLAQKVSEESRLQKQYRNLSQFILTAKSVQHTGPVSAPTEQILPPQSQTRRHSFCCLRDTRSLSLYDGNARRARDTSDMLSFSKRHIALLDEVTKQFIQRQRAHIAELEGRLEATQGELEMRNREIQQLHDTHARETREREDALRRKSEAEQNVTGTVKQLKEKLAQTQADNDALRERLEVAEQRHAQCGTQREALEAQRKQEQEEAIREVAELRRILAERDSERQQQDDKLRELQKETEGIRKELATVQTQFRDQTERWNTERAEADSRRRVLSSNNQELVREKVGWTNYYKYKKEHRNVIVRTLAKKNSADHKPWLRSEFISEEEARRLQHTQDAAGPTPSPPPIAPASQENSSRNSPMPLIAPIPFRPDRDAGALHH
eukprot:TRINITY_DN1508_c0_g1_i1.p1 TRINITY_DN1508_c0_g1~~TRINITY_DN1508_c0_g1_i1.p1  ORF type:complete len:818 (-),score=141.76 TRINITY_DN1508_c0_g1_i1:89-2542(-)